MTTLKKAPRLQAKIVPVSPLFLLTKDAIKYTGLEFDTFKKAAKEFGLSVYARGPKKIWYKKTDLDSMLESYKVK